MTETERNLLGKLRFVYNAHYYGGIYVYCTFWTLVKHFLVVLASWFGVDETREEMIETVEETFRQKFEIPDENKLVIGETARSLFYTFLLALKLNKDDIVILTPLQHYSFIRILTAMNVQVFTVEMKRDGSGWDWDSVLRHLSPQQTARIRACVVTHMFGYNQEYESMVKWCHGNDVFIFEDCIQGYNLFQDLGHAGAHISVFSGGMDKIPCTTKGGFGIVRHNMKLADEINGIISNFPDQTWEKRFSDIVSQFAYWFLTSTKFGTFSVLVLGLMNGFTSLHTIIHWVRKNFLKAYTGVFTVKRVEFRPSVYHLKAMALGVERSDRYYTDMLHEGREKFRQILGEKYTKIMHPWKDGNDYLKEHANLYWHFLVREREECMHTLSDAGWGGCYQQAWDCVAQMPGFPEPIYARYLKENMAYLPVVHQMLECEMEELADTLKGHIDQHHADGEPALPKELMN